MSKDRFTKRFNGQDAFARLPAEQQAEIGGIALELVVAWNGQDAYLDMMEDSDYGRPFRAVDTYLMDALHNTVNAAIPDTIAAEPLPIPSLLGGVCRCCGCSEEDACFPSCGWAEKDLCSQCVDQTRNLDHSNQEGSENERPQQRTA